MGIVLWFTGLSGSGKTTIALALKKRLEERGQQAALLDGDQVRSQLHPQLGFSPDDIKENNRRIAQLAKKMKEEVEYVLVPIISPYEESRRWARHMIGAGFIEVYVNCPQAVCLQRDTKGLYHKAQEGLISDLIGFSPGAIYEKPHSADIEVRTDREEVDESVQRIVDFLGNASFS